LNLQLWTYCGHMSKCPIKSIGPCPIPTVLMVDYMLPVLELLHDKI
jgi:hypothetical protein